MKILFVHQNFPAQYKHLSLALAQQGHEVWALGMGERPPMAGIRYFRYGAKRGSSATVHPWVSDFETKVIRGEACLMAAQALLQQGLVPDLICLHPGWGEGLFLKEVWPGVPQLHYLEFFYRTQGQDFGFDPEFEHPQLAARARLLAKNANHLMHLDQMQAGVCPTTWQCSTLPAAYRDKVSVIHDGIDTQLLTPDPAALLTVRDELGRELRLGPDDEVITFVSRNLEPFRGYHTFMRALPRVLQARPRARVVIVGGDGVSYGAAPPSGSWKQRFLDEVAPGLDMSRVHFTGRLPYPHLVKLLQLSACHVYLSYPFVLSWSMLEAMSLGAVVVGSATPPVQEVISHGHNGWLVDFFSPAALADQVVHCLRHPQEQQAIRQAARQTIVERYDLQTRCLPAQLRLVHGLV